MLFPKSISFALPTDLEHDDVDLGQNSVKKKTQKKEKEKEV